MECLLMTDLFLESSKILFHLSEINRQIKNLSLKLNISHSSLADVITYHY